jgi:hypothetical protein
LLAFLDLVVSASDEVLPCLSNDASVVEIGRMIDQQTDVVVAGLVRVVVE